MTSTAIFPWPPNGGEFRHEALVYSGTTEFLEWGTQFVAQGVEAGEPVLVVVSQSKIDQLRQRLGAHAEAVQFTDMAAVGRNPARILSVWQEFAAEHADGGRPFRGIGEPVYSGRSSDETAECEVHEALLNQAFTESPPLWLVCPYDVEALDESVIERAMRSHPFVQRDGSLQPNSRYRAHLAPGLPGDPLPQAPRGAAELAFEAGDLTAVRAFVSQQADVVGLSDAPRTDLLLAVNELATNSLRHGGGRGTVRTWQSGDMLVCEVRDAGRVTDPLVGRKRPPADVLGGRGLWLVNQLCDLVQLRSSHDGAVVRVHMAVAGRVG